MASSRFTITFQPPPGPSVCRPTSSNPHPTGNPLVFTQAMNVRDTVFVVEQKCDPDAELDEDDARSWHWVLYDTDADTSTLQRSNGVSGEKKEKKQPVAVVRLVPPPHAQHGHLNPVIEEGVDTSETCRKEDLPFIRLTRVAVLKEYRGQGLSRMLVEHALDWAAAHPEEIDAAHAEALGGKVKGKWDGLVLVHSQTQVQEVYKRLGFVTDQGLGTWVEERIVHVGMWKELDVKRKN